MVTKRAKQSKRPRSEADQKNNSRAYYAAAALGEFRQLTGADLEDAVSDLLANLMHWCDRHGQNFDAELQRGRGHYEEEV